MTTDDTARLAENLSRELRHIVMLLRRTTAGQPVTAQQYSVLGSLEDGARRMTELAEEHGVQLPTMSVQVSRLEEAGLVARGTDASDARVRTVELTGEGRDRLRAVRRARIAYLSDRLDALTVEERTAIAHALPALAKLGRA
ncbi:MarR family transcriptional regulator [Microbispora sp. SCL1-1]|uniref:MarR family winged helix-turn-helix transcriptional regulator n=1 Tax=unclassified Microbispora TaxID=2614687 RepID=UPI001159227B|nr:MULTISPECIES: MarR family transcriptional regulator [unclassified Microbispora]NJP26484.1 MarR family transcriptional regulator [Microbispora sp. CL1-1]TQS12291.1 MarR family transcriptional regulator [Microbispora sp. SCL1-1]